MAGLDYRINEVEQLTVWQIAVALGQDKPAAPSMPAATALDDDTANWVMAQFAAQQGLVARSADASTGS